MDTLTYCYNNTLNTWNTLKEAQDKYIKHLHHEDMITYRDSLIKRFEYSYKTAWKLLKRILDEKYNISHSYSKIIFKECVLLHILTKEESEKFSDMADSRNNTSHIYKEELAEEISNQIINDFNVLYTAIKNIKKFI